jgi:DNA repair protein RadC
MLFNTKQMLLREICVSKGSVNAAVIGPREIFIEALRYQAVSVIMIHNHPSGDPEPSREDILLTQRVQEAGILVGVPLLDHIIIGDGRYISLKERGYI